MKPTRDPIGVTRGWNTDGWPHERDENGTCRNCGAVSGEYHYRLKPKPPTLEFTTHELAELYVILSGNHDIPAVYLNKVGAALKGML